MAATTILVVDDEQLIRWSLTERLRSEGHDVLEAETGARALEQLAEGVDLVLLDYKLPDLDGLTVLRKIKEFDPDILVILLTAYASVETAVEAMKEGAYHFANKPFNLDDVAILVSRALETTRLRREVRRLRANQAQPYSVDRIVGESPVMAAMKTLLTKVATSPASTVLLTGESGTGKDLAAKVLHYNSDRAQKPFMNITCSALTETLLESELFGHERGAYTDARDRRIGLIAQAEGGTLFLDEVDSLTPRAQVAVLRVIQDNLVRPLGSNVEQRVDVRFIAATNLDLDELVHRRAFREDLYYRLCVMMVSLPPLRERRADILLLARHFLQKHALRDRVTPRLAAETEVALLRHEWPGNVRELENAIIRGINLAEYDHITPLDVGLPAERGEEALPESGRRSFQEAKKDVVASFERQYLTRLLSDHRGNVSRAARTAGKERRELGRLLKKHRIDPRDFLSTV